MFYTVILLTNIIAMHDFVIFPIVNILYEMFPDSTAGVNFIISGPALFTFVSSLMTPFMMKFMSKKRLLSIVCIIFTVSSVFEAAIVSLPYIHEEATCYSFFSFTRKLGQTVEAVLEKFPFCVLAMRIMF